MNDINCTSEVTVHTKRMIQRLYLEALEQKESEPEKSELETGMLDVLDGSLEFRIDINSWVLNKKGEEFIDKTAVGCYQEFYSSAVGQE